MSATTLATDERNAAPSGVAASPQVDRADLGEHAGAASPVSRTSARPWVVVHRAEPARPPAPAPTRPAARPGSGGPTSSHSPGPDPTTSTPSGRGGPRGRTATPSPWPRAVPRSARTSDLAQRGAVGELQRGRRCSGRSPPSRPARCTGAAGAIGLRAVGAAMVGSATEPRSLPGRRNARCSVTGPGWCQPAGSRMVTSVPGRAIDGSDLAQADRSGPGSATSGWR